MSSSPLREATAADAEAITALFRAAFGEARTIDADEIRSWFANAEIRPENVRVLEIDGRVVGYGDVWPEERDLQVDVAAPGHWDVFFDWAEQRARDAGIPQVRAYFDAGHELEQVVAARGYRYWRSSFTMQIEIDARPAAPALPEGLELRPYRVEDAETVRAVLNDAFAEDPFWHPVTPSNFQEFYLRARGADTGMWLLAWDRDRLAGTALTFPERFGDQGLGWISNLAVGEAWRRRGLGGALLRHAFQRLYDRGLRRVGLGVDAENATGALHLYESAGMHAILRNDNWALDV